MAWHVASRSALSASGLSEPLVPPLDLDSYMLEVAAQIFPDKYE